MPRRVTDFGELPDHFSRIRAGSPSRSFLRVKVSSEEEPERWRQYGVPDTHDFKRLCERYRHSVRLLFSLSIRTICRSQLSVDAQAFPETRNRCNDRRLNISRRPRRSCSSIGMFLNPVTASFPLAVTKPQSVLGYQAVCSHNLPVNFARDDKRISAVSAGLPENSKARSKTVRIGRALLCQSGVRSRLEHSFPWEDVPKTTCITFSYR